MNTSLSALDTRPRVCRVLGCLYPILQAGMGGVARFELAAAVSAAGGFGSLGMVRESPELIAAEVARVRQLTSKPFSVNLIPSATDSGLFEAELEACADAGVHHVTYFWDVDEDDPATIEREQIAEEGGRPIYRWSADSPLRNMTGTLDELALFAGQVAGEIESVVHAADRVTSIMNEAHNVVARLTGKEPS